VITAVTLSINTPQQAEITTTRLLKEKFILAEQEIVEDIKDLRYS
jgi:hypothetical protein